jgi:hypothetical protein
VNEYYRQYLEYSKNNLTIFKQWLLYKIGRIIQIALNT